jgi:hypothetical protein
MKNVLKVDYKYELTIPKDKSEIPTTSYSSSDENENDEIDDDEYHMHSDRGTSEKKLREVDIIQK